MATAMLDKLYEKYKRSVADNPDTVGQLEATCRIMSYIIAGRFEDSQVLSELVYTASNLLILFNDAILQSASKIAPKLPFSQERLMRYVTILEYMEVFIEMAASRFWGDIGRWILITVIQIAKATFRFLLLWRDGAGIQPTPPIRPADREKLCKNKTEDTETAQSGSSVQYEEKAEAQTYTLKRSGMTIRKLSAAPPMNLRTWKVPVSCDHKNPSKANKNPSKAMHYSPTKLSPQRAWGETIYIVRPLVHLFSLAISGTKSWKPWLISCGLDLTSMCMMGDPQDLNPSERGELKRRTLMVLYYLLRSPFYDRFSQAKIVLMMRILADNIPGMSLLIQPMLEYLPAWQKVYFYIWST